MLTTHPELTDDPRTLRWVLRPELIPFVGRVQSAPESLQGFLNRGELERIEFAVDGVLITATSPQNWADLGPRVQSALSKSLSGMASGSESVASRSADLVVRGLEHGWVAGEIIDRLGAVVDYVLAGKSGDFVASHGGEIEVIEVSGDVVKIRFGGECSDCPARMITLQVKFVNEIRKYHPWLKSVDVVDDSGIFNSLKSKWLKLYRK